MSSRPSKATREYMRDVRRRIKAGDLNPVPGRQMRRALRKKFRLAAAIARAELAHRPSKEAIRKQIREQKKHGKKV